MDVNSVDLGGIEIQLGETDDGLAFEGNEKLSSANGASIPVRFKRASPRLDLGRTVMARAQLSDGCALDAADPFRIVVLRFPYDHCVCRRLMNQELLWRRTDVPPPGGIELNR